MSVSVSVEPADDCKDKSWYTSHEHISGSVNLNLKTSVEVNKVLISLFGISETSLTRVDDFGQKFTDQASECSLVLDLRDQLFPPSGDEFANKYALRAGSHSWPFSFEFPMYTTNMDPKILPPSLSDMDPDMASIRYYLRASVEYSSPASLLKMGTGSTSVSSSTTPIVFLPSDDNMLDAVPTYGVFHSNRSRVISSTKTVSGLFSRIVTTLAHDRAPTCSDIGIFTARSELLLTPGLKFSWSLEVTTPTSEKIYVMALNVELVSKTYVRAKNVDKIVESRVMLLDRSGLQLRDGDLTSQLQNPILKVPENTPPTFNASNLRREYFLEFKVKWTHKPSSALSHKAYLSRRAFIRSGMHALPNYETGEIPRANREFPQAKWYFKVP